MSVEIKAKFGQAITSKTLAVTLQLIDTETSELIEINLQSKHIDKLLNEIFKTKLSGRDTTTDANRITLINNFLESGKGIKIVFE